MGTFMPDVFDNWLAWGAVLVSAAMLLTVFIYVARRIMAMEPPRVTRHELDQEVNRFRDDLSRLEVYTHEQMHFIRDQLHTLSLSIELLRRGTTNHSEPRQ